MMRFVIFVMISLVIKSKIKEHILEKKKENGEPIDPDEVLP